MCTLALAALGCGCCFLAWYPRAGRPRRRLLGVLAVHLCFVAAITVNLSLLAARLGAPVLGCVVGAWFGLLAGVHAGHMLAIRHWGTPLHRPVVSYTLRNLFQLATAFPREAFCGMAVLVIAFAIGAIAAVGDLLATMLATSRFEFLAPLIPIVTLLGFAGLWWARRERLSRDPLLRLFFDANITDFGIVLDDERGQELRVQLGEEGAPACDSFAAIESERAGPATEIEVVPSIRRRATVVLFVVDSLRAQHLSFHGYERSTTPFLASCIAERGARAVPLAVANCASSECGSSSLLTSRRYRHLGSNTVSLHQILRRAGYKVGFFLSGIHRGWMGMESLYGADPDCLLDRVADTRLLAEAANLPVQEPGGSDFFCFHLMSVHCSGALTPRFRVWRPSSNRLVCSSRTCFDARMREGIVNHYDNSILQTDDYIREICSQLERKGYLRDAVVIVTADHGESLGERSGELGHVGHANSLFQEAIHIPLFIMDTKGSLPETAILADQTDVAPTIADLLGMESPGSWQGQSIFQQPFRQSTHVEFVTHPGRLANGRRRAMEAVIAVRPSGIYKLLRHRESGQETYRAAFCLSADPVEMQPIADEGIVADLEAVRRTFVRTAAGDQEDHAIAAPARRAA